MANKRGRPPGFQMGNEHRVKIRNSNILNALIEHVEGIREMSSTQVTAGLGLLKKVMPDLSAVEMKATVEHRSIEQYSTDELITDIAREEKRISQAQAITNKSDPVH